MSNVRVLPLEAMRIIKRAAQTQNTEDDPRARERAIDHAVAKVRRMFPEYFVSESHNGTAESPEK